MNMFSSSFDYEVKLFYYIISFLFLYVSIFRKALAFNWCCSMVSVFSTSFKAKYSFNTVSIDYNISIDTLTCFYLLFLVLLNPLVLSSFCSFYRRLDFSSFDIFKTSLICLRIVYSLWSFLLIFDYKAKAKDYLELYLWSSMRMLTILGFLIITTKKKIFYK